MFGVPKYTVNNDLPHPRSMDSPPAGSPVAASSPCLHTLAWARRRHGGWRKRIGEQVERRACAWVGPVRVGKAAIGSRQGQRHAFLLLPWRKTKNRRGHAIKSLSTPTAAALMGWFGCPHSWCPSRRSIGVRFFISTSTFWVGTQIGRLL
jgi:hypothetical protein